MGRDIAKGPGCQAEELEPYSAGSGEAVGRGLTSQKIVSENELDS